MPPPAVVAPGDRTLQKEQNGGNAPLASSSFSDPGTSTLPITQHHRWLGRLLYRGAPTLRTVNGRWSNLYV